jgi:hypothetical protein
MYIHLYTSKQLQEIKERMLWLGLFMLSGGMAALLHNLVLQDPPRWYWAGAALLVTLAGILLVAVGTGRVPMKEAYCCITSGSVSYRLGLLRHEHIIYWQHVNQVQVSDKCILFDLNSGRQVAMQLGSIQSSNIAGHIATSLQLAALKQNIALNGVRFNTTSAGILPS